MKTLVIVAHPNIEKSRINKTWVKFLSKEDNITVHEIYNTYKDGKIDIALDQNLLEKHDKIVFQFPFYWYNVPSFLKQWQDEVLTVGFSHGPGGDKLKGKEFMLVISAGGFKDGYQAGGYQNFSISELTKPLQNMSTFTGMKYMPPYVLYGAHKLTDEEIKTSAEELVHIIQG
ncbi:general stress protein [Clostridium botulinum]|uniref:NAD(P)H-dependent oxidoreductase n=1 Tax=Clostridium sp. ZBS4 TaxID=2949974 RepID=UPI001DECA6CC|nr:NAD(P)H-dependent oxidoreductase [Clostridium sp. ZBS4]MBN1055124.1 general stress protein [Clostridium botulinum]